MRYVVEGKIFQPNLESVNNFVSNQREENQKKIA